MINESEKESSIRLPLVDCSDTLIIPKPLSNVIEDSSSMLSKIGKIIKPDTEPVNPCLFVLVGSGAANMNPTIVCLEFVSTNENSTT